MTDHVTSADGTDLAVRTWGEPGQPVVILIHGLGLSTHSWGHIPEMLAEQHHVIAYDLRGHGASGPAPTGDYGLAAQAFDLAAVLDHAVSVQRDPERGAPGPTTPAEAPPPVVLAGHSLGGAVILAHARAVVDGHLPAVDGAHGRPHVVAAVFVGSSGSSITLPGLAQPALPAWARAWVRVGWLKGLYLGALLGRKIGPVRAVANTLARKTVFTDDSPSPLVDQARQDFISTDPTVLARTTLASASLDGTLLAPALAVPTLVLRGELDKEVTAEDAARLMAGLPDAELVTLPSAGHMIVLTHQGNVAGHIARWTGSHR